MVKQPIVYCDHCGSECQRVVTASIGGRELHFCCKGCLEVYRTLHEFDDSAEGPGEREPGSSGGPSR